MEFWLMDQLTQNMRASIFFSDQVSAHGAISEELSGYYVGLREDKAAEQVRRELNGLCHGNGSASRFAE
jgi:hypothetical protein